jgi:hypothetical protein
MQQASPEESKLNYYGANVIGFFVQNTGVKIDQAEVTVAEFKLMEYMIASDVNTPPPLLWLIAKFGSNRAAVCVAQNAKTPDSTLRFV